MNLNYAIQRLELLPAQQNGDIGLEVIQTA
jgi:hypothetical protein